MKDSLDHDRDTPKPPRWSKQILCVWLPNWPVQRIQAADPKLADQPLGLVTRDLRRGMVVAAANLHARAAGVRSGMRLAEATGLVDLQLHPYQPDEDLEALCSLAECAQRFSPLVGLEQLDRRNWAGRTLDQPECLLLDVTGLADLFAGYENLMMQFGGWLHSQRYFGCLATAGSVGAAWALANYAMRGSTAPVQPSAASDAGADASAEVDADSVQPVVPQSRYLHVDREEERALLEQLPLSALRLDPATLATLRKLGLRTFGQLTQLPRAGLANRLGAGLLERWDQLTGACEEPVIALHGSPEWCIEQELEIATEHTETIAELVRRGLSKLAQGLERCGEGALRVVCRLDLVDHVPLVLQLGMYRPTCDPNHLQLLIASLLEQQLPKQMKSPMWRVVVQATLTAPLVWRQGDLFNASQAANAQEMAGLIDTLSARLGRRQVLRAKAVRESQPELAFEMQPLTGLRPDGHPQDTVRKISSRQATRTIEPTREDPLRRPAELLQRPTPIEVAGIFQLQPGDVAAAATAQSQATNPVAAAPARIRTANGWHQVVDAVGPERLESGWWKGQSARRDYYRVTTHLGCWWWIYRDLNSGQWFLHGLFD